MAAPIVVIVATEAGEGGGWATSAVRAWGPGVPADLRPVSSRASPPGRTGGAGLYLARGIAEARASALTLEGTDGIGTTFRHALPSD